MTDDVLLVAVRLAVGAWLLWRLARLPPVPDRARRMPLTVVVPARDEADNLPPLLASLREATRRGDEIVVVDDGSTDATASVAEQGGAQVVSAPERPAGWAGKPWACQVGARHAHSPMIVFCDADVTVAPDALDRAVAAVDRRGGLVSVQPHHRTERPYEQLSALFNVVAVMGSDAASPLGHRRGPRGAFGPFLCTARHDYDAAGGHEAVRDKVVEDTALALRYRETGRAVHVYGGGDTVGFRMYPQGFGQLVEGWTKNMALGARGSRFVTLALVVAWLTLLVQASWWLVRSAVVGGWEGVILWALVSVQLWWMLRRLGRFSWYTSPAFPVLTLFFLLVFLRSVVATAMGRVSWRGRQVPTR